MSVWRDSGTLDRPRAEATAAAPEHREQAPVGEQALVGGQAPVVEQALVGEPAPARERAPVGAHPAPVGAIPPAGRRYLPVKRLADALAAGAALLVLSPVIACVWVAVLVRLGRPALFVQERVTRDGRRFRLRKFRTMLPADPARGRLTDAQRLTSFGAWLRATSLDELPSLWNILVGDMSVIGPRPLPTRYLEFYSPAQHDRHVVRAGLTGLAQVSGRNNVPWDARFELDQKYVLLMGPLLDLAILARTVTTVLSRSGVSEGDLATATVYTGPGWTPRVRFEERGESTWAALTPEDVHLADCTFRPVQDPVTGETRAELTVAWRAGTRDRGPLAEAGACPVTTARTDPDTVPDRVPESVPDRVSDTVSGSVPDSALARDVVTLLLSRARGAECASARIDLGDGPGRCGEEELGTAAARPPGAAAAVLEPVLREAGFRPVDAAGTVLTTDLWPDDDPIDLENDPIPAGAGRLPAAAAPIGTGAAPIPTGAGR